MLSDYAALRAANPTYRDHPETLPKAIASVLTPPLR